MNKAQKHEKIQAAFDPTHQFLLNIDKQSERHFEKTKMNRILNHLIANQITMRNSIISFQRDIDSMTSCINTVTDSLNLLKDGFISMKNHLSKSENDIESSKNELELLLIELNTEDLDSPNNEQCDEDQKEIISNEALSDINLTNDKSEEETSDTDIDNVYSEFVRGNDAFEEYINQLIFLNNQHIMNMIYSEKEANKHNIMNMKKRLLDIESRLCLEKNSCNNNQHQPRSEQMNQSFMMSKLQCTQKMIDLKLQFLDPNKKNSSNKSELKNAVLISKAEQ